MSDQSFSVWFSSGEIFSRELKLLWSAPEQAEDFHQKQAKKKKNGKLKDSSDFKPSSVSLKESIKDCIHGGIPAGKTCLTIHKQNGEEQSHKLFSVTCVERIKGNQQRRHAASSSGTILYPRVCCVYH